MVERSDVSERKGYWSSISDTLRERLGTLLIGILVAIFGVFSDKIVDTVKFAINKADLRVERYETFSQDLSNHIFLVELMQEYLHEGWTTKDGVVPILLDYNKSITLLRKKEYVYRTVFHRYWDEQTASQFSGLMATVREVDRQIHGLNDEFEAVNILETKEKIDSQRAEATAAQLKPLLENLRTEADALLRASL
jgi:hypothetical protein